MYVDVPPVHDASKVIVLPTFCVDGSVGEEVKVGIPRVTNTTSFDESCVSGVVALSVTPMQYELDVVGVTVMLFDVALSPEYVASTFALSWEHVLPLGPVYHFIVYVEVPPDHDDVSVTDWPLFIEGFNGEIVGVDRAGFIVSVFEKSTVLPTL